MSLINQVLLREEIVNNPPILVDIGASGKIHKSWKAIAKHSICIAFDADQRDFGHVKEETKNYKKLYTYNCIVADKKSEESDFHLTNYPHCSSLLPPDHESLQDWSYASYFKVDQIAKMKTIDLPTVFQELKIDKVDWFKSDSQGIDLRLFKSLGNESIQKVLVAEFEPGIINAYKGEDKLYTILSFMESTENFWLSDLIIKGSQRISEKKFNSLFTDPKSKKLFNAVGRKSPGWGEMVYINTFKNKSLQKREFLLGWVFATIQKQHGFAFEIAEQGHELFKENLFKELAAESRSELKKELFTLSYLPLAYNKLKRVLGIN